MVAKRNKSSRIAQAGMTAKSLGVFRGRDFVAAGFSREYLRRLVLKEQVQQLGRGVYAAVAFAGDGNQSLIEAAKRFPQGIVCLISALRFHEIGTQAPFQIWMALPRSANLPKGTHSPLRFFKFSPEAYRYGIREQNVAGGVVRVYSPAKTVADCFKYRNKFGLDVAVEALREGWRARKFTMDELAKAAEVCRVRRVIQPYLEMLV